MRARLDITHTAIEYIPTFNTIIICRKRYNNNNNNTILKSLSKPKSTALAAHYYFFSLFHFYANVRIIEVSRFFPLTIH